jgi:hypothetical protein
MRPHGRVVVAVVRRQVLKDNLRGQRRPLTCHDCGSAWPPYCCETDDDLSPFVVTDDEGLRCLLARGLDDMASIPVSNDMAARWQSPF